MSWARFTPDTVCDELRFVYVQGDVPRELTIKARRIIPTEPILSSTLYVNYRNAAVNYEGARWQGDYYYRYDSYNSSSYWQTLFNLYNTDPIWRERAARFNEMLLELDDYADTDPACVLAMSSDDAQQFYNRTGTGQKSDGQKVLYVGAGQGSMRLALYGETTYTPSPVTTAYNYGIFSIDPDGESGLPAFIAKAGGLSAEYNSATPPIMAFFSVPVQMDDADHDGDHYGESVQCLLICLRCPGSITYNMHTICSLNAFDSQPVQDEPTTDDQSSTVTPSGWVGAWDFSSDSDDVQAVGGYDFCNRWAHGIRLYYITDTQAEAFMQALWSMTLSQAIDLAIDSALFRSNVDFVRGVICLHKLPVVVSTSGSSALTIMGYDLSKTFPGLSSFAKVSGTYGSVIQVTTDPLQVPQTFGDAVFLDWQCKAQIRLPFIGMVPIDIKAIRGGTIKVSYNIDVLTGNLIAQVFCRSSYGSKPQVLLYQGSGNCSLPIPYSGNTEGAFKQLGAVAGVAGGIAAGVATGSTAAALGALRGLSYGSNTAEYQYTATEAGSMTDLSIKLIITGEVPIIPPKQRELEGYQAATTAAVSSFAGSGYLSGVLHAEITDPADTFGATAEEKQEIESLFAGGVIV